jgi:hypothetical protein
MGLKHHASTFSSISNKEDWRPLARVARIINHAWLRTWSFAPRSGQRTSQNQRITQHGPVAESSGVWGPCWILTQIS